MSARAEGPAGGSCPPAAARQDREHGDPVPPGGHPHAPRIAADDAGPGVPVRPTIAELLARATDRLGSGRGARLEAEVLLAHLLGRPRTHLHAWPEGRPPPAVEAGLEALLARRLCGEPVAYLTGHREFWSLDLEVNAAVLVPRADTERLVEVALALLPGHPPARVADLGTGSGAVALAIASERPRWQVDATDRSPAALAVARRNALRLGLQGIRFLDGDWCEALDGRYHLLLSNPPYVESGDACLADPALRHEPRAALDGGRDGLDAIRRIATGARLHLHPGAPLALEHGHDQGPAVRALLAGLGYREVQGHRDDAGLERVASARWMGGQP
jgi:release factor glutamine methyltransferase